MAKKKILVIDDEKNFTQLVKLNLEETDKYEVKTENKGAQGLNAARVFQPDLILLDIVMPDMEGSDVAFQIKSDAQTRHIPIVFLTAIMRKEESDSLGGIKVGETYCAALAKPVNIEELIACIEKNTA
ncbi:MAG: response regulator [Candidatus Omnitrophota bacterium]